MSLDRTVSRISRRICLASDRKDVLWRALLEARRTEDAGAVLAAASSMRACRAMQLGWMRALGRAVILHRGVDA